MKNIALTLFGRKNTTSKWDVFSFTLLFLVILPLAANSEPTNNSGAKTETLVIEENSKKIKDICEKLKGDNKYAFVDKTTSKCAKHAKTAQSRAVKIDKEMSEADRLTQESKAKIAQGGEQAQSTANATTAGINQPVIALARNVQKTARDAIDKIEKEAKFNKTAASCYRQAAEKTKEFHAQCAAEQDPLKREKMLYSPRCGSYGHVSITCQETNTAANKFREYEKNHKDVQELAENNRQNFTSAKEKAQNIESSLSQNNQGMDNNRDNLASNQQQAQTQTEEARNAWNDANENNPYRSLADELPNSGEPSPPAQETVGNDPENSAPTKPEENKSTAGYADDGSDTDANKGFKYLNEMSNEELASAVEQSKRSPLSGISSDKARELGLMPPEENNDLTGYKDTTPNQSLAPSDTPKQSSLGEGKDVEGEIIGHTDNGYLVKEGNQTKVVKADQTSVRQEAERDYSPIPDYGQEKLRQAAAYNDGPSDTGYNPNYNKTSPSNIASGEGSGQKMQRTADVEAPGRSPAAAAAAATGTNAQDNSQLAQKPVSPTATQAAPAEQSSPGSEGQAPQQFAEALGQGGSGGSGGGDTGAGVNTTSPVPPPATPSLAQAEAANPAPSNISGADTRFERELQKPKNEPPTSTPPVVSSVEPIPVTAGNFSGPGGARPAASGEKAKKIATNDSAGPGPKTSLLGQILDRLGVYSTSRVADVSGGGSSPVGGRPEIASAQTYGDPGNTAGASRISNASHNSNNAKENLDLTENQKNELAQLDQLLAESDAELMKLLADTSLGGDYGSEKSDEMKNLLKQVKQDTSGSSRMPANSRRVVGNMMKISDNVRKNPKQVAIEMARAEINLSDLGFVYFKVLLYRAHCSRYSGRVCGGSASSPISDIAQTEL